MSAAAPNGHQSAAEKARADSPRQLIAASVGNMVEWYDWYAYSFLAVYFADQVFSSEGGDLSSLLKTFAVFAVGFFFRPIGGLVMGAVADRAGRKTALTLTILLMGVGSLLIAIMPTYAQAGVLAPVVLVVARIIQGLSVGGEFAASTTFLVESAPDGKRGLFSSFQYVSTTVGQLLASGLAAVLAKSLSESDMQSYGWRIPFFVGAVLALVGLVIRRGAHETLDGVEEMKAGARQRPGLFDALRKYPKQSLLIVGITIAGTIAYYTWTTYLPTYATTYAGTDPADALTAGTIALVFFGLLQPVFGALSDKIGRKPMLITMSAFFTLGAVPLLGSLGSSMGSLLLVQCIGMVFLAMWTSISAAVNAETIPTHVRASGIGFPYSLSVALFGGTAPYVGTWLKDHDMGTVFPWYVSGLCLISLLVYLFAIKETAHKPLPD